MTMPSILMWKNVSINKIIKKVNKYISNMCAANGFYFTCKDMIDVSMTWMDHLTNDGRKVLGNDFLKY